MIFLFMDDIIDNLKNKLRNRSNSSNGGKFREIHSKVNELYNKNYSKLKPDSLRYLEFNQRNYFKPHPLPRAGKTKDKLKASLAQEHPQIDEGTKIIDLPKSPFGRHKAYNEHLNFIERHFLSTNSPETNQSRTYERKISLLKKRINKKSQVCKTKGLKKFEKNLNIFATDSGNLFCKQNKSVMRIYELEAEKFKNIHRIEQKNSNDLNGKILELKIKSKSGRNLNEVINRLYTPSPKMKISFIDSNQKYQKLFDSELLNNDKNLFMF